MTVYIADIASYQRGINLDAVKAAGFTHLNIKTSQGNWYQFADAPWFATEARKRGMGVGTFHWLDASDTGQVQAQIAYNLFVKLGGPEGMFHQVDCEDNASFAIWSSYVDWWQQKLGRHIVNYSGDWWWQPKGWEGASRTPYHWAAPNVGYLSAYPGDTSSHWLCGYGGWSAYSLLQYAVSPIAGAGSMNVSKTAVRDPAVLAALRGESTVAVTNDQIWAKLVALIDEWEVPRRRLTADPTVPGTAFDLLVDKRMLDAVASTVDDRLTALEKKVDAIIAALTALGNGVVVGSPRYTGTVELSPVVEVAEARAITAEASGAVGA